MEPKPQNSIHESDGKRIHCGEGQGKNQDDGLLREADIRLQINSQIKLLNRTDAGGDVASAYK